MEDRELLDLAARAQGWIDYPQDSIEAGSYWHLDSKKAPFGPRIEKESWQPLNDDREALRLAVDLRMSIEVDHYHAIVNGAVVDVGKDPRQATRRAIVLAAADIGRAMS